MGMIFTGENGTSLQDALCDAIDHLFDLMVRNRLKRLKGLKNAVKIDFDCVQPLASPCKTAVFTSAQKKPTRGSKT